MKELVVISGKGGTGKTSLLASFAALAERPVVADCDVDAADLHLVLSPRIEIRSTFRSGNVAEIRQGSCTRCGDCVDRCRFDAVHVRRAGTEFAIDPRRCEGCGVCVRFCPADAIAFPERTCGERYVSRTRFGPMVHARLFPAADSSGKLVSTVRREARAIAARTGSEWLLVDGPPGTGCPVIASVTGASLVLVVTEPTPSGRHDMERVLSLARHFRVPALVAVNKWDLNPEAVRDIERVAEGSGATCAGRVRYDRSVTAAQIEGRTVAERGGPAAQDIEAVWRRVAEVGKSSPGVAGAALVGGPTVGP